MSGSVSLAPTNVRHDADRLHPLRRTQSDRDLAHLIRTLLRFSAQRERGLSTPTSSAAASREKPGSAQSAPTVPAAGCRRRIGRTPRREGSGRPPGDVSRRRSWQGPHAGRAGSHSRAPLPPTMATCVSTFPTASPGKVCSPLPSRSSINSCNQLNYRSSG